MQEFTTPDFLQDAKQLLSATGFATDGTWYHGTASGLVESIQANGLIGSGDAEGLEKHLQTLSTIGHEASSHKDPLFVTQSKELAYFWANRTAHNRNLYFQKDEKPVVFELNLPEELQAKVITDAGGAALVLEPGNLYILWLEDLYKNLGFELTKPDPFSCDRMDYQNFLGLSYINEAVPAEFVKLLG